MTLIYELDQDLHFEKMYQLGRNELYGSRFSKVIMMHRPYILIDIRLQKCTQRRYVGGQ